MKRGAPMKRTPFARKNTAENIPSKVAQIHSQRAPLAIKLRVKMTTKSKPATPAKEKRYLDRVAQLDCVVCGAHGVHVHHLREGQGMAQLATCDAVIMLPGWRQSRGANVEHQLAAGMGLQVIDDTPVPRTYRGRTDLELIDTGEFKVGGSC